MAMIELLQSPAVKVLGITIVSGNAWGPEEVAHVIAFLVSDEARHILGSSIRVDGGMLT